MREIEEMRMPPGGRKPKRSFMGNIELRSIRVETLKVTQVALATNLIDPSDGEPISPYLISHWEAGSRAVPLWAARHIRILHDAALEYDRKEK